MARNLLGILLILIAIGVAVFFTNPMWLEIQEMKTQKASLEETIKRFNELKKVRNDLLQKYNSISEGDLKRLEAMLPPKQEPGILLVNLENLSKASNLSLKRIDIRGKHEEANKNQATPKTSSAIPNGLEQFPFEISVSGSYESCALFLKAVEKNLRLIDIDSLSFASADKNSYDFTIGASTYWQKP